MANTVRLDTAAITRLLNSQSGPLVRDLALRAQRVTNGAKRRCPVDQGRLRSSIRWVLRSDSRGLHAVVGTDVEYALFVHEGTRDHDIRPRRARVLRFPSTRGRGGFAYARIVHHPGTTGVPFLRDALVDAA